MIYKSSQVVLLIKKCVQLTPCSAFVNVIQMKMKLSNHHQFASISFPLDFSSLLVSHLENYCSNKAIWTILDSFTLYDPSFLLKFVSGLLFHVCGEAVVNVNSNRADRQTDKENYIDFRLRLLGEPGNTHSILYIQVYLDFYPMKAEICLTFPCFM